MKELHESCAVFGMLNAEGRDAAATLYAAMFAMQHRGQNGVGLAGSTGRNAACEKNLGLVVDVLSPEILRDMARHRLILGHVRYPASGEANTPLNAQPLMVRSGGAFMALAHNGRVDNVERLRRTLKLRGALFQTDTDSELLLQLISSAEGGLVEKIRHMMDVVQGAYALTFMAQDTLLGIRDPWGIRPLSIGKKGDSWLLASESCAFTSSGAELVRDVRPGEVVQLTKEGPVTLYEAPRGKGALCSFEYVYFARPDSVMDSVSIYAARERMGRLLYKTAPVDADIVAGVPDSALPAAMGYAAASGIPYAQALIKSPYIGRTFIAETQAAREMGVRLKLHPLGDQVAGKRLILVDDSIVRGTNMRQLVGMLRAVDAREIHLRVASPAVMHPCHYGINSQSRRGLISTKWTADELAKQLGADSLAFLPQDALEQACAGTCGRCTACFDGAPLIG